MKCKAIFFLVLNLFFFTVKSQYVNVSTTNKTRLFLATVQSGLFYSDNPSEVPDTLNSISAVIRYDHDIPYLIVNYIDYIHQIDASLHTYDGVLKENIMNAAIAEKTRAIKLRMKPDYMPGGPEILRVQVNNVTHFYTLHSY